MRVTDAACFRAAAQEMEALGLCVTEAPHPGSEPYGVLAGKADSRLFLLPLRPRAACLGSLGLIQPMRFGPRAFKGFFAWTIRLGMARIPLRGRVHVSGVNRVAAAFGARAAHSAFLTGTAGPHRKLVVQCMDGRGNVMGYAKVSRTPAVHGLLANDAAVMRELRAAGLRTAIVPRVLLHDVRDGTAVLATDTVPAPRGRRPLRLQALHLAFLDELAARTASARAGDGDALLALWNAQVRDITNGLSSGWRIRFWRALHALEAKTALIAPRGLAHGDFTPVNSFPCGDRLFVFDWEYAGRSYPADFDLIRFLAAATQARPRHAARRVAAIQRELARELGRSEEQAHARLVAYVCACALRGACRQPRHEPLQWESERGDAAMLDALLSSVPWAERVSPRNPFAASHAVPRHPSRVHEACRQTAPA